VTAEEDTSKSVIILGGNGIKFVIVAAGASESEAEESAAGDVDLIIDNIRHHFFLISVAGSPFANDEEAGGNKGVGIEFLPGGGLEEITGKLLEDKLVIRKIGIEGFYDPIAVTIGFGNVSWTTNTAGVVGIGVTDDIEPMPGPAFAVEGGSEQTIDEAPKRIGGVVAEKVVDLLRSWRDANEVEVEATDESAFFGGISGAELGGFQLLENEMIYAIARP
jgi:hypothetical protein